MSAIDTGHVLVNFLITGEYSCLKPKGESMDERHASEFTTALHVSGVAESYGLSGLRDLAMNEMQKLGDKLTMFSLIRIMEEARPTPVRIPEVAAYIRSRMQDFCNIPTIEAGEEVLSVSGTPQTIGELVLKSVVEIHLQELSVEKQAPQGVNGEGTSPATKIGESMLIEKQEPEPEPFDGREQEQPPRVQVDVLLENPFLNPLLPRNAAKNDSPVPTSSINPMPRKDKKQKKKKSETATPPAIFEPAGHPNDSLFQISKLTLVPTHVASPESPSHEPLTPGSGDDTHGLQLDCANRSDHLASNGDWKNCSNCRKLVRLFSHELDMAHE
ncbi:hypothetical protein MAJ_10713, partial [Metarhizium majus ARSEF 297]